LTQLWLRPARCRCRLILPPNAQHDYQTAFAKHQGAVAAPTASLHFDDALLAALQAKGVEFAEVTLHVALDRRDRHLHLPRV